MQTAGVSVPPVACEGNYLAFGDVKMIPGIPVEEFERIVMRASYVLVSDLSDSLRTQRARCTS